MLFYMYMYITILSTRLVLDLVAYGFRWFYIKNNDLQKFEFNVCMNIEWSLSRSLNIKTEK